MDPPSCSDKIDSETAQAFSQWLGAYRSGKRFMGWEPVPLKDKQLLPLNLAAHLPHEIYLG